MDQEVYYALVEYIIRRFKTWGLILFDLSPEGLVNALMIIRKMEEL
jgi:hypothetical protein